jgi:hypothetical protein
MSNADVVELYLLKRDSLESDERRMIIGLLGFAAPPVTAPTTTPPLIEMAAPALPAPEPVTAPKPLTVAPAPGESPRGPYRISAETRRRLSEAAKARNARDGGAQLRRMVEAAAKVNKTRRDRGEVPTVNDESRRKMSEAAKARWARGDGSGFRKRHHHTEETRRKMSESAKARWSRGDGPKGHQHNGQDTLAHRLEATLPPMGHTRGWERSDGCEFTRKKRYPNLGAAQADIQRLSGKPGPQPIRAYSCNCGGWHITSQEERGAGPERIR